MVFYFCRLGDMVMLTTLLNLLHRRYGLPCHVIGTGSWTGSVYQGNPDVAGVWSFGRHFPFPLSREWPAVRRALRESAPGPIYIVERHYRQLPRIRRMLRLAGVDPARCVFITEEPQTGPEHLVDRFHRFARRTPEGLSAANYPPLGGPADGPRLYVLESEQRRRDAWMRTQGWFGRPYVVIQPGNHRTMGPRRARWKRLNTDDKAWPVERWVELLRRLQQRSRDLMLVLRGSVEEVPMLQEIAVIAALEGSISVVGNGLRDLFALCHSAHSVISVDTGPAHAAAALGAPLVVLYGAEPPRYWLPRSPTGSPVVGVGGPPVSVRADQVSVDDLFGAWLSILGTRELARPDIAAASLPVSTADTYNYGAEIRRGR